MAAGTYPLTITATNAIGATPKSFTLTVISSAIPTVGIVATETPGTGSDFALGTFMRWSYKATGTGPFKFYTNMV